jgi:hypothetical protein
MKEPANTTLRRAQGYGPLGSAFLTKSREHHETVTLKRTAFSSEKTVEPAWSRKDRL